MIVKTLTIAAGAALSNALDCDANQIAALMMPDAWTAAPISFEVSTPEGIRWLPLFDAAGNEVQAQVDAGRYVALGPVSEWDGLLASPFSGVGQLKLRSGLSAVPVNQTDAREIFVILKGAPCKNC